MIQIITECGAKFIVTPQLLEKLLIHREELHEIFIDENYPRSCNLNESNTQCDGCYPEEIDDMDFNIKFIKEANERERMVGVPIYEAKKIDSDEYVEGTGTTDFLNINAMPGLDKKYYNDGSRLWLWSNYSWIEIDRSTISISFDNGEHFHSFSFVKRAIEDHAEETRIN